VGGVGSLHEPGQPFAKTIHGSQFEDFLFVWWKRTALGRNIAFEDAMFPLGSRLHVRCFDIRDESRIARVRQLDRNGDANDDGHLRRLHRKPALHFLTPCRHPVVFYIPFSIYLVEEQERPPSAKPFGTTPGPMVPCAG
jgi:hypothetical protein